MTNINSPSDMLQKEAFKILPAKEKEEYITNLLKKVLELNPEGVTISQIKEATGLTYSTIWHHLEVLSCTAQGHKVSKGNLDVYYPAGKMSHLNDYEKGKARYAISTAESKQGTFICIHEKRQSRTGNDAVCSGVAMPIELIDQFIEDLKKIR